MARRLRALLPNLLLLAATLALLELAALGAILLLYGPEATRDSVWRGGREADADGAPVSDRTFVFHPLLTRVQIPNARIDTTEYCDVERRFIETDAEGRSIVPDPLPDPELVVAVAGGSTVFGVGASGNAHTIPARLQAHLRAAGVAANVHNLGARGAPSFLEFVGLRLFLAGQPVDYVVAVSGRNDAYLGAFNHDPLVDDKVLTRRTREIRELEAAPVVFAINGDPLRRLLRRLSFTFDLALRLAVDAAPVRADAGTSELPPFVGQDVPALAGVSSANYALMDRLARETGGRFLMFLQPTLFTRARWTEDERACVERIYAGSEERLERYRRYEAEFYQALRARPKPYRFQDLSALFDDVDETIYVDNVHYVDAGTDRIAAAVAGAILADRAAPER